MDTALELALAQARLERAEETVRVWTPAPAVAFGRLDALRPGFPAAVEAARRHGFAPLRRDVGGLAAAYGEDAVVLDVLGAGADAMTGMHARFADAAERIAGALRSLGVDARVGEVEGAYCPGAFSVNARGAVKLVGTAQRVVRGAWHLSAIVIVDGAEPLRAVLTDVYGALGHSYEPATTGAVAAEAPGVTTADVTAALTAAYGAPTADPSPAVLARAHELRARVIL